MADATLCASGATSAWQVEHFVRMDVLLRGRCNTLTLCLDDLGFANGLATLKINRYKINIISLGYLKG